MISRRSLLAGALAWTLRPSRGLAAAIETRRGAVTARVSIMYGVMRFEQTGLIEESIDRPAGRYEVRMAARGDALTTEIESSGVLRDGRWTPILFRDHFSVYGRQASLEIVYDHARGTATYHGRSETFLLRRLRIVDDVVPLPSGVHVDDVLSATLNYAEGRWPPEADGSLVTRVVRRQRRPREGPDDVDAAYRAELVPFVLRLTTDPGGKTTAVFDLTRFSTWAREDEPARIVFGADRRPESIDASLILGTSLAIRVAPTSGAEGAGGPRRATAAAPPAGGE